jgi:hypothetical protein
MTHDPLLSLAQRLPAIEGFPTVDELRADLLALQRANPGRIDHAVIGRSRLDEPIDHFTIGDGPLQVVIAGGVHPNEPIGFRTVQQLVRLLLAAPEMAELDATWHIVPCADPDGARLNESWFGSADRIAYFTGFYRPAPGEQVEWSFPFDYKQAWFDHPIPETRALMALFDRVQPDVFVGLHNAEFGGVYFYLNQDDTVLARELRDLPAAFGLPLDVGEPEMDGLIRLDDAVFRAPLARERYDHREALGLPPETRSGGAGTADYLERYGTTTMIAELPYWTHPDASDTTPTSRPYRDVIAEKADALDALHVLLQRELDRARPALTIDSPFRRASEAFVPGMGEAAKAERARLRDPALSRPATVAEVFGNREVARTFRLRFGGILRRALAAEVDAGVAREAVRSASAEIDAAFARWLADETDTDLVPAPVSALVGVQLAAVLATVRRRRG